MSRIGKKLIEIQKGITVEISKESVSISGPKGQLSVKLPEDISVLNENNNLIIRIREDRDTSLQGLTRSLIQNAVTGVNTGWQKTLELVGVGYRAQTSGSELTLNLGFSHPVIMTAPVGITFSVNENKITVYGVDKYLVGEVAAKIRRLKPPEPYKGKGIRYLGEVVRKKLGKAAKAIGGTTGAK